MSSSAADDDVRIWKNPYLWGAVVFALAAAIPFCTRMQSEWDDVFVRSAIDLREGRDVYRQPYGYTYPPFQMVMALPFADLPVRAGRLAWFAVNAVCIFWMIASAWALSGGPRLRDAASWSGREHAIFLLGLACGVWYSLHCLAHQQTDVVVAAFVLGGCRLLQTGRSWKAAALFGLATAMKCTPLLFAPYLAFRRKFVAAGLMVAVAMGVNLLPELVHRSPADKLWIAQWQEMFLKPMADKDHVPGNWHSNVIYNQSLGGAFHRWTLSSWSWPKSGLTIHEAERPSASAQSKLIFRGIELSLICVAGLLFCRRFRLSPESVAGDATWAAYEYSVVAILMLLFSPMSSIPHFATLILPGFCLARHAVIRRDRVVLGCVIVAAVAAAFSNKDLQGGSLYTLLLWHGVVMLNAIALLAGLYWTLLRLPPNAETASQAPLRLAA